MYSFVSVDFVLTVLLAASAFCWMRLRVAAPDRGAIRTAAATPTPNPAKRYESEVIRSSFIFTPPCLYWRSLLHKQLEGLFRGAGWHPARRLVTAAADGAIPS